MKRKYTISKLHKKVWREIWGLCIKYGAISFLVLFGIIEFFRKFKLYDAGVPLFVFDSEPLITHYAYGKTIITSIIFLPGVWLAIIGCEHYFLYKDLWKKSLAGFVFLIGSGLIILGFSALFQYKPPQGDILYLSKDYQVIRSNSEIQLKIWDKLYKCERPHIFEDICIEESKKDNNP